MDFNNFIDQLTDFLVAYTPRLLGAIIVLIVGLWVIRLVGAAFVRFLGTRNIDSTLKPFLKALVSTLLKVMLVLSVLAMLGMEMTSFIAVLGAIGLAVGLALSGTLQNFAGGVIILIIKPYKVGDFIEANSYSGTVHQVQIFYTILKTPDNRTVILPNGEMSKNALINYSTEAKRRVDLTFGIGYGDDVQEAREVLTGLIQADDRIVDEPEPPFIAVKELADSSVNLIVKVWTTLDDFWGVHHDLQEKVYNAFNEKGLNIPYPQMDVHVHNQN